MSHLGTWACESLRGTVPGLTMRTRTWQVPGMNGYGAQRLGLANGEGFRLVAIKYGSESSLFTWLALIEALVGTITTAMSDWNRTWTGLLIQRLSQPRITAAPPLGSRMEIEVFGVKVY